MSISLKGIAHVDGTCTQRNEQADLHHLYMLSAVVAASIGGCPDRVRLDVSISSRKMSFVHLNVYEFRLQLGT